MCQAEMNINTTQGLSDRSFFPSAQNIFQGEKRRSLLLKTGSLDNVMQVFSLT